MVLKVKVLKVYNVHCHECENEAIFFPIAQDWEEIEEQDILALQDAIKWANEKRGLGTPYTYFLVTYEDTSCEKVFNKASEFQKQAEEEKRKEGEKKRKAKEIREAKSLERKKKQLEKLKKELEKEYGS